MFRVEPRREEINWATADQLQPAKNLTGCNPLWDSMILKQNIWAKRLNVTSYSARNSSTCYSNRSQCPWGWRKNHRKSRHWLIHWYPVSKRLLWSNKGAEYLTCYCFTVSPDRAFSTQLSTDWTNVAFHLRWLHSKSPSKGNGAWPHEPQ